MSPLSPINPGNIQSPTKLQEHQAPNNVEQTGSSADRNGVVDSASTYSNDQVTTPLTSDEVWRKTLKRVEPSVVAIHFNYPLAFDGNDTNTSQATGFVVDAARGIILTNRHVASTGPFRGYCVFSTQERCTVKVIYRDPVHDFAFLQYAREDLRRSQPNSLSLRPDRAETGVEVRILGNDAGAKFSVAAGILSRLDSEAPHYKDFWDFNTFYLQLTIHATGGSSGSPVVNLDGDVVGLQCGRQTTAATCYLSPIDRIVAALKRLQLGEKVPRGSLQTEWKHKSYDDCCRLGLSDDEETRMRELLPNSYGLLVVQRVLPGGQADGKLREGDIVLELNGTPLDSFVPLEDVLDENVGKTVHFRLQRGGEYIDRSLQVQDLQAMAKPRLLSVAGALFQDLPYMEAHIFNVNLESPGTYVTQGSGAFRFMGGLKGYLIQQIDGHDTPDLDAFIRVMNDIENDKHVGVQYVALHDLCSPRIAVTHIDRRFAKEMKLITRNEETFEWDFKVVGTVKPRPKASVQEAQFAELTATAHPKAIHALRSFVLVTTAMPIILDGNFRYDDSGYGLVVDAAKGLVMVSQKVVPTSFASIKVVVADSLTLDAKAIFFHPSRNYTIIKYDASLIDERTPIESAKLSTEYPKQADKGLFMGFGPSKRILNEVTITEVAPGFIEKNMGNPRYVAYDYEMISIDTVPHCGGGALLKEDGTVIGLWMGYVGHYSLTRKATDYHWFASPMAREVPIIERIRNGEVPDLRMIGAKWTMVKPQTASTMGVTQEWIQRVWKESPDGHQLYMVGKLDANYNNGLDANHDDELQVSDIILTLDGKLITQLRDFDVLNNKESVEAVIIRKKEEKTIKLYPQLTSDRETRKILVCCGMLLQKPHHAVAQCYGKLHSQVYVTDILSGSPADLFEIEDVEFVDEVNGAKVSNLDEFLTEVKKVSNDKDFRVRLMDEDGTQSLVTLRKDLHYFPTVMWEKMAGDDAKELVDTNGWKSTVLESLDSQSAGVEMAL